MIDKSYFMCTVFIDYVNYIHDLMILVAYVYIDME